MLKIFIPNNFIPEREYIISYFFDILFGLKYEIKKHELPFYRIILPNNLELTVVDHFFSRHDEKTGYLDKKNLPSEINFFKHDKFAVEGIPLIFGDNSLKENKDNTLCLDADIFASSFYMLTRWEEYISGVKDDHGRFPSSASLAVKNKFLHRPIVNEYAELLWKLLLHLGYKGERKKKEFRILPTHDIDQYYYWDYKRKKVLLKNLSGDLFLRKSSDLYKKRLVSFLRTMLGAADPCDTFEFLMDKAEKLGSMARFYFIAGGDTVYEKNYSVFSEKVRKKIERIIKRGHVIGIHPSYNSYNNQKQLNKELYALSEISGGQIKEGRNHYLRFEIPSTWNLLQQAGLCVDSSMYYSELPGFRCGICNEFPVFDILKRKKLDLIERPMIVMDTTFKEEKPEVIYSEIIKLKETVRKYSGDFVFLWHNSNIITPEWKKYKRTFEEAFYGNQ